MLHITHNINIDVIQTVVSDNINNYLRWEVLATLAKYVLFSK